MGPAEAAQRQELAVSTPAQELLFFFSCWPLKEVMNSNPWHQGNKDEPGDCFLLRMTKTPVRTSCLVTVLT